MHKSQGMSLDKVSVIVREGGFTTAGLYYVALSRARTLQGLHIAHFSPSMVLVDEKSRAFEEGGFDAAAQTKWYEEEAWVKACKILELRRQGLVGGKRWRQASGEMALERRGGGGGL